MRLRLELGKRGGVHVGAMLAWPRQVIEQLRQNAQSCDGGAAARAGPRPELLAGGPLDAEGNWTELGQCVLDLLLHERWQDGDEVSGLLRNDFGLFRGAVLDVGCSTGCPRHAPWCARRLAGRQ